MLVKTLYNISIDRSISKLLFVLLDEKQTLQIFSRKESSNFSRRFFFRIPEPNLISVGKENEWSEALIFLYSSCVISGLFSGDLRTAALAFGFDNGNNFAVWKIKTVISYAAKPIIVVTTCRNFKPYLISVV